MPIDALSVLCAQLTRDLLAIAKFLLRLGFRHHVRQLRTASVFRSIKNVAKMSATAELLVLFTRVGSGRVGSGQLVDLYATVPALVRRWLAV